MLSKPECIEIDKKLDCLYAKKGGLRVSKESKLQCLELIKKRANDVNYEQRLILELAIVENELKEIQEKIDSLEKVYSEHKWNRAFICTNGNGHVHKTMLCSTCYVTTRFAWMTDYSASTEQEIVEAAGSDACTICYPTAPVELKLPRTMFAPE